MQVLQSDVRDGRVEAYLSKWWFSDGVGEEMQWFGCRGFPAFF
jgi:hypothetical protein